MLGSGVLRNTNKKPHYIVSHSCHQPLRMKMMTEEKGKESGLPSFLPGQPAELRSVGRMCPGVKSAVKTSELCGAFALF